MLWRKYFYTLLITIALLSGVIFAFNFIVDPYDVLSFSPKLDRRPMTSNQRYSYPGLAQKSNFDSAVFGTSTFRLLNPSQLNSLFDSHFVNLSMDSALAYEQWKLFQLFFLAHPTPKKIIIGLDVVWCNTDNPPQKQTFRGFPEWLYKENHWSIPMHLFNFSSILQSLRQLAYLSGHKKPRFGGDGYANFLPPSSEYDLEKAKSYIYGKSGEAIGGAAYKLHVNNSQDKSFYFPTHAWLKDMLNQLPGETQKILVFAPYHYFHQAKAGTLEAKQWSQCKADITQLAQIVSNTTVLDFMIKSNITTKDSNYWDPLHYNIHVAEEFANLIAKGVKEKHSFAGYYDYLKGIG